MLAWLIAQLRSYRRSSQVSDPLDNLSADDRAAVEALLAKRRKVRPEVLDTPAERARIHAALRLGCAPHDGVPDLLVNVQAHDVMVLCRWIDELQASLLASAPADEPTE